MRFTSTLLLAALAALAQAGKYSVEGLTDGGYIFSVDTNGNQVNETIDASKYLPPSAKFRRGESSVSRRSLPANLKIVCRDDGPYDDGSMVTSRTELGAWCDSGNFIPPGGSVVFVNANSVFYACSNGGWNPCSSGEVIDANSLMDAQCGAWTDVNLYIPDWAKSYGRDTPNHVC